MSKSKIFVIMPFEEEFFELYNLIKGKFGNNYEFSHAGDLGGQQNILKDIVHGIHNADIILADLSTLNPNVFYELGIAHTLNKKVIIITQSLEELPFDLRSYRANAYNTRFSRIKELTEKLSELLDGAIVGNITFGSPVADFLPRLYESQNVEVTAEQERNDIHNIEFTEGSAGYIDYICDLNEAIGEMGNIIEIITQDIEDLVEGITQKSIQFQRLNNKSELFQPSNGRKILRDMAKIVINFSNKLKSNNQNLRTVWNKIENNFLSLLDNKWMRSEENKQGLVKTLKFIVEMRESLKSSTEGVGELVNATIAGKGLERSLDSAINTMSYEISTYNDISDNAVAIIDRIVEKSKILVENLDEILHKEL